ncbi:Rpn family recombination-promoting nuclease/putative transposase [Deferribacterales bacterium RsTz2092]|nr:hypothetical protein AGMMS49941_01200 [Deferribacterales bacterium]
MNARQCAKSVRIGSIACLSKSSDPKILIKYIVAVFNFLAGTDVATPDDIELNTLENVLFMDRRNDLSFVIGKDKLVVLVEHQSTVNHNMPLRFLEYITRVYEKMIDNDKLYKAKKLTIPRPEFIVLYNGIDKMLDESTLRLSDMFNIEALTTGKDRQGFLELEVKVFNVNNGRNSAILDKCRALKQYAGFVEMARKHTEYVAPDSTNPLEQAMEAAVKECIEKGILKEFLIENSKEVINMLTAEFSLETARRVWREEAFEEGEERGKQQLSQELLSLLESGDMDALRRTIASGAKLKDTDIIS